MLHTRGFLILVASREQASQLRSAKPAESRRAFAGRGGAFSAHPRFRWRRRTPQKDDFCTRIRRRCTRHPVGAVFSYYLYKFHFLLCYACVFFLTAGVVCCGLYSIVARCDAIVPAPPLRRCSAIAIGILGTHQDSDWYKFEPMFPNRYYIGAVVIAGSSRPWAICIQVCASIMYQSPDRRI